MVLKAHLGPVTPVSAASVGSRRTPRRELLLETSGVLSRGGEANVTVHNISETGLLIETELPLQKGESLSVELPHVGRVTAEIVWTSDRLFGCAFADLLSPAALAAAELRAEVSWTAAPRAHTSADVNRGETLGPKLNRLRREQGLTLAQVAEQLGVSKPTVWAWEKGKAKPLPERYEAIAEALGVPTNEITEVSLNGDAAPIIEESRIRIGQIYGVDPNQVRIMIDL